MNGFTVVLESSPTPPEHLVGDFRSLKISDGVYAQLAGAPNTQFHQDDDYSIVFYGYSQERTNYDDSGALDFSAILSDFTEEGVSCFGRLKGHFCIVLYTRNTKTITLVSDRLALFNIFYRPSDDGRRCAISNRVSNLKQIMDTGPLSQQWLGEVFHYRIPSGSHTAFEKIRQVPGACYVVLDSTFSPIENGRYWSVPPRRVNERLTLEEAAGETERLLVSRLGQSEFRYRNVAVLLSGGVDSSVLAALARPVFDNCVAFTPAFARGENPELDIAVDLAGQIGITHEIVEVTDDDIVHSFSNTARLVGHPVRSHSTLIFDKVLSTICRDFDAVIFGEGGDTTFGYKGITSAGNEFLHAKQVQKFGLLLPRVRMLESIPAIAKVARLRDLSVEEIVTSSWDITYDPPSGQVVKRICKQYPVSLELCEELGIKNRSMNSLSLDDLRTLVKLFLIMVGNYDHYFVLGALSEHYGLEVISPFMDQQVIEYACSLPDSLYYGDEYVKPVLREIGARHFKREYMYLKKKGFPVPVHYWLNGPLADKKEKAMTFLRSRYGVSSESEVDDELLWSVMSLLEVDLFDGGEAVPAD
jgi:asparagine synthase (glutamine-hydrolysing)